MYRKISILGAGESGTGAAILAKAKGYDVFVSDLGKIKEKYQKELIKLNIEFEQNTHSEKRIIESDLVIKSPGIDDEAQIILTIKKHKIEIIDELEFASRYTKAKIIAITGTNGKTTTTLLTHHLLSEAGLNVGIAGNIGSSLARQVATDTHDYYVVEMSSFQIDGIDTLTPHIAVLLNITPDHLDRYDNDFSKYIASKFKLIEKLGNGKLIYFSENKPITENLNNNNYEASLIPVSLEKPTDVHADDMTMYFGKHTIERKSTTLKGEHNTINTLCSVAVALELGVEIDNVKKGLTTFKNIPHRLEYVGTINGAKYYNDSKATNVASAKYALESFDEKIVWIAGGVDKGNDYEEIRNLVSSKVRILICLGKDNKKLVDVFSNEVDKLLETNNMLQAVLEATEHATDDEVVLLSPACASFDLFDNYEARGDEFKKAVESMKNRKQYSHV